MKLSVFAIYDVAIGSYLLPSYYQTKAQAIRAFRTLVNTPDSNVNQNPKDYRLFLLAEYNDELGTFTNHDKPELLANAPDLINAPITALTAAAKEAS